MAPTNPLAPSQPKNNVRGDRPQGPRSPTLFAGDMKIRFTHARARLGLWCAVLLALAACAPVSTPTFFIPPTAGALPNVPAAVSTVVAVETPLASTSIAVPTIEAPTATPVCKDGLTYVQDLTIPDGTNIAPGQPIDKQWLVSNSGTCNWDSRYRLKLVGGDPMGVQPLQALYPARAGTQATLQIVFVAPQQAGLYQSRWQAVGPDGLPFGDPFYVQVAVTP